MGVLSKKGEIILDYLKRFPDLPTLTLAKKIYKDTPESFKDVEQVRFQINYHTGKAGKKLLKGLTDKSFLKQKRNSNPYGLFPTSAETFIPYEIKSQRTLIISDLHFPYQHNKSIELALDFGKQKKVDCILINGDL